MKLVLGVWLAGAAALFAAPALVTYAALTITTAAISFPNVTLDGSTQILDGSTNAWRADAVGETGGWKVTVASGDFSDGNGKTIAVANLQVRLLDANIVVVSGDTNGPVSSQTTFAAVGGTPFKIASAAVGDGDGVYDLNPDFRLTVPAETFVGNYTATVTVDVSVGP